MLYLIEKIKEFPQKSINKQMVYLTVISLAIFSVIIFLFNKGYFHLGSSYKEGFYLYYESKIRGYLFSGFISVGSFLLSLHTFVIVNLKDKLFDSESYQKSYIVYKKRIDKDFTQSDIVNGEYYAPLNTLSFFLNLSVWLSIITAFLQFSLGFLDNNYTALLCLYFAFITLFFLLNCLILIRCNIKVWLSLERKK